MIFIFFFLLIFHFFTCTHRCLPTQVSWTHASELIGVELFSLQGTRIFGIWWGWDSVWWSCFFVFSLFWPLVVTYINWYLLSCRWSTVCADRFALKGGPVLSMSHRCLFAFWSLFPSFLSLLSIDFFLWRVISIIDVFSKADWSIKTVGRRGTVSVWP